MEPRFSGPDAPWNKPPVLKENGLGDIQAWMATLPVDMRPAEKRLAFRREVHWTLKNVRGSVGEELFNMLFDILSNDLIQPGAGSPSESIGAHCGRLAEFARTSCGMHS